MIEARDLARSYGDTRAVDGLSFSVAPGEILGFLGPNGAGKSTTVKILTGMIAPSRGEARVAGFDVVRDPLAVKQRIGYVPESGALYETLSPSEYLELVSALHHLDPGQARSRSMELLERLGLGEVRDRRMTEFSKGMKQKVLVAAALVHRPDVLFLDEPLNGLDANAAMLVKELVRGLAAQGRTILFCTHVLDVAERMCTRLLVINRGRSVADGAPADVISAAGATTLDEAFSRLTGAPPARELSAEVLAALDR